MKIWDLKMGQILYTVHGHQGSIKSVAFSSEGDYFCSGGEDAILMVWKSNIKNMDEEFNTLSKVNEQNVIMSNKQKFNLEETKTEYNNNYMGNMQKQIEGGENVIKKVKIPNKHLGERYKVVIEPCLKNLTTNVNVNVNNNEFSQNESSLLINNSKINPFSKLPTELASTFDKMITQLDIITKTMRIMETRISTVEGQITELYNIRKMGNFMEDKNVFNQNLENEVNNNNNNVGFENNVNNNVNDNIQENIEDNNVNNENNNDNNDNFENNNNYEQNEEQNFNNNNNIEINEEENYYQNNEERFDENNNENNINTDNNNYQNPNEENNNNINYEENNYNENINNDNFNNENINEENNYENNENELS
jgi:hypothetical protein